MVVQLKNLPFRSLLFWICIGSLVILLWYATRWSNHLTHGFAAYYTSARMLLTGDNFSQIYNIDFFHSKIRMYGLGNILDLPNNLPTTSYVLLPLAWLSPVEAKIIWTILLLLSLGLSCYLLFRVYDLSIQENISWGILSVIFLFRPVYENIGQGQLYIFILLLFSSSLYFLTRNKPFGTALPIAFSFIIKGYGAFLSLWFLVSKKWKVLTITIVATISILFVSFWLLGSQVWLEYFRTVFATLGRDPSRGHIAFQTFNSLIRHTFSYDPTWSPSPVIALSKGAVDALSIGTNLLVMIGFLALTHNSTPHNLPLVYSIMMGVSVVTAPMAEEHHFVLFLPLIVGMIKTLFKKYDETRHLNFFFLIIVLAILILSIPLKYKVFQFSPFPVFLIGYIKLYAGITLLGCSTYWIRKFPGTDVA